MLGVDGGGAKTSARLLSVGPSGRLCLLGSGLAGGSNPLSVGWDAAQSAIGQAIAAATEQAGAAPDAAVLAIAGCASPSARERLDAWAQTQGFAPRLAVVPDTEPLLATVPAGESAIGLIAGTGTAALVRRTDGTTEVVGGWGYLIDDAGSGYAVGRDALRHVALRADRGEPADALTEALLLHAGVGSPPELKGALYGAADPRGWAARLAPMVLGLAASGDPIAIQIATENAAALAALARHTALRVGPDDRPRVRLAGGLAVGSPLYRSGVIEQLVAAGWAPSQVTLAGDAACACGQLAARLG
ncbi:N-acetylglucosamine kinase [Botrimarina colliarenosi]|uniref:N-acetylglucosamine kinase n=1 Tax=Botrimarina colliarenosi TaxID=2528001 RepID=UPI001E3225A6|nr:BadF/BadG/BcrA/BcrD ATPase family protein [Botrimarina colliarenosi]